MILEEGVYLQVKKKKKTKKSRPTDPNVEDYAIGNTPFCFWPRGMTIYLEGEGVWFFF